MTRKIGEYFTKEDIKKAFAPSDEKPVVRFFTGIITTLIFSFFAAIMLTLGLAPITGAVLCICKAAGTLESMTWVQACSPFMAYTIASILTTCILKSSKAILNPNEVEEEE